MDKLLLLLVQRIQIDSGNLYEHGMDQSKKYSIKFNFIYRIQSDSLASISAILEAFITRLNLFGKKNDFKKKMKLISSPQLPTANLIELLDKHMAAHTKLEEMRVRNFTLFIPQSIRK